MSAGDGRSAESASSGRCRPQLPAFLLAGGRPTPKLLLCRLQSRRLNQSPARGAPHGARGTTRRAQEVAPDHAGACRRACNAEVLYIFRDTHWHLNSYAMCFTLFKRCVYMVARRERGPRAAPAVGRPRGCRRTRVVRVAVQALGAQDLIARMEEGNALREAHARKRQRGHARAVGHGCALGGLEHHLRAARRTHRRAGRAGPWQRCAASRTFSAPSTPAPGACTLPTGVPMQLVSHSAA